MTGHEVLIQQDNYLYVDHTFPGKDVTGKGKKKTEVEDYYCITIL